MTHSEKFEEFHTANPGVYDRMVQEAREWKAAGHGKLSIGMLVERVRWVGTVENWSSDYKLNQNHAAYYARLIMAQEPDLEGFFDLRDAPEPDAWITDYISRKVTVYI